MRGLCALAAALVLLAACQPVTSHPQTGALRQCQAQSGFAARAALAQEAGVEGEVLPTTAEQAAISACLGPGAVITAAPVSAGVAQPDRRAGVCRLELVGGDGYRCARNQWGY